MNESKPPRYHERIGSIHYVKRLLPGVLLCVAITLAAIALERIEVFFVGQPYLEALVRRCAIPPRRRALSFSSA
jgi:hypothetical protein